MSEALVNAWMGGFMTGAASSMVHFRTTDEDQNNLSQELAVFLLRNNITIKQINTKFAFTCKDLAKFCFMEDHFDCCKGSDVIAHRDYGSCFTVRGKIQR